MTKIEAKKDDLERRLDEMADISEYWKKHRSKGRTPNSIRHAMLYLCREVVGIEESAHRAAQVRIQEAMCGLSATKTESTGRSQE